MLVAYFHFGANRRANRLNRDPVDVTSGKPCAQEIVVAAHDHALRSGFGGDDVKWFGGGNAQPAALPDRKMMNSLVFAKHPPVRVDHLAARALPFNPALPEIGVDKCGVVAVRDEADFL